MSGVREEALTPEPAATATAELRICAEDDGEPAVVGVGQPPVWLCLRHYDERMAAIGATVRRLREAMDDD